MEIQAVTMILIKTMNKSLLSFVGIFFVFLVTAQDGSSLWLGYSILENETERAAYAESLQFISFSDSTERMQLASKELQKGLQGLLGNSPHEKKKLPNQKGMYGVQLQLDEDLTLSKEGFEIEYTPQGTTIKAKKDLGILYGVYAFLREMQLRKPEPFTVVDQPKVKIRMLNHWDNANGTVERGYAGSSIWKWFELPYRLDPRYEDYARANAALGINGVTLNNVNASSRFLTSEYLEKIKALADVFRPYGIQIYISVNFRSPKTLGGLETSDPLDPAVRKWWKDKTREIHQYIPDFGGFLVKANSEGEPGPQDYGRTHKDGANMLADALQGYEGIVIWRAFVYKADPNGDRFKEAYKQFKPLDGTFDPKVIVQVKNGPIDFMPREPFHPLFGALPNTPLAMEFQITQEYLGQATHWVYLGGMYQECLRSDTYAKGPGSSVAKVIDGSLFEHEISLMAGVANTGSDANWTGHPMGQSNWYAFGRLAWNPEMDAATIAKEWVVQSLSRKEEAVSTLTDLMMSSHATYVKYTYPLGLHHMMGEGHHYGPQPWLDKSGRPDWTSVYYHRASASGIGFDRTGKYSDALDLYHPEVQENWKDPQNCSLDYLLWFHHLPWDFKLSTGNILWDELIMRYYEGVAEVEQMNTRWESVESQIPSPIYENVRGRLKIQAKEALWWRDACTLYFKKFSQLPIPEGLTPPSRTLEEVKKLEAIYHLR